ncbi:MAG: DUF4124 domain-containing protein [Myxococcota bacterium]
MQKQHMQQTIHSSARERTQRRGVLRLSAGVLGAAFLLATPMAASAEVYGWRTDDGVFAYTDDKDQIPSRYVDRAVRVNQKRLADYPRLTKEDTATTRSVSDRLAKRLEHLRRLNATETVAARGYAPSAGAGGRTTVSVATGSAQAPNLDIETDASSEPIVVEPILTKAPGKIRTRRSTVIRQGDKTLAIVKGRPHSINPNEDIYDEDELLDR